MLTSTQLDRNLVSDPEFATEMGALLADGFQVSAVNDTLTMKLDWVLIYPVFGLPLFFCLIYLLF